MALASAAALAADFTFEIPPVPVSVELGRQDIAMTVSGELAASPAPPGARDQSFNLNVRTDLDGLQHQIAPLLREELDRSDRCGERLSVGNATLKPSPPTGDLAIQLHFEKWICVKALGDSAKKLLGGDATVHVTLTPLLERTSAGQVPRLDADISTVEADAPVAELLRSDAVSIATRDKIREALQKMVQKATDLDGVLPTPALRFVNIGTIEFADGGFGRLALDMAGRLQVPGEEVSAVLEAFGNR